MITKEMRTELLERANGHCEFCGGLPDFRGLAIHHRKPKGMGGTHHIYTADELVVACGRCHSSEHHIREV